MIKQMKLSFLSELAGSLILLFASVKGLAVLKFGASIKVALIMAPFITIMEFISDWSLKNQDYIAIVLSAIIIDHILGSIRHSPLFDDDFSMFENIRGLFIKLILVIMVGILFEELHHLMSDYQLITGYTISLTRLTVFLYPFGSAIGNSRRISGGRFPPTKWFDKFDKYLETWKKEK